MIQIYNRAEVNNELVATAVLVTEGNKMKMQRVAVLEKFRNQAIGCEMMLFCEQLAREKSIEVLYCHVSDTAVNFYSKNRYEKQGEYFEEDGIPHLVMRKRI